MKMSEVYKFIRRVFIPIVIPLAVCACSVKVAIDANEIAKMQAIITLNSTAPEIDVCESYTIDDKSCIDISVLGGRAANLRIEAIAFIDVEPTYYAQKYFDDILQIPCYYCYPILIWGEEVYGSRYCLVRDVEYDKISNLQDLLYDYYSDSQMGFNIKLHSYVKVGYINVLGEDETVYFSIGGIFGDERIVGSDYVMDKNAGKAKFEEYDKLLNDGIELILYDDDEKLLSNFFSNVVNSSGQNASDLGFELYVK